MKNLRNEIYQEMHGFKVLKRDYTPKGKSKWYYIDPRYDNDNDQRREIEVSDENMPNPRLNAILADDIRENPQNYYIWRTCKDDKVRGKHAEREGKVFNKHIPPEGGNPGEDYNCRCRAEPYDAKEYADKSMIIDVSGLEMFKEIRPVDFNTKGFPQYAANDKANAASDAEYTSNYEYAHRKVQFRSLEEEKLLRRIGKQIVARENTKEYVYLDSSGYITTGNGALIDDWKSFRKVHWLYNSRPATEEEMRAEFDRMEKIRGDIIAEAKALANKYNRPYSNPFRKITAKRYEQDSVLRITRDEADYLMYSHLQRDYNILKKYLPEIDQAPEAAQDVAFDIQYNPGITDTTWTYFKQYFNEKNISELAKHVHRIGVSEDRNNEMKDKILSIKKW